MEEAASGIDCEETNLDKALQEIIVKEKAAMDARSLQDDNKNAEKAPAEEHRKRAVERLGETKTSPDGKERKKIDVGRGAMSERESVLRKEDLELRQRELSLKEDMMKMLSQQ